MKRPECQNRIREIIRKAEYGSVFVTTDFADLGEKKTVNMALIRLAEEGLIKNVMFGVYYKPEYNELLDEDIAPFPDDVAHAIARNFGWTIVPCGDTALNQSFVSINTGALGDGFMSVTAHIKSIHTGTQQSSSKEPLTKKSPIFLLKLH